MKTLYLFGNGFDIAHGINTSYSSFRSFLNDHHEEFLASFEKMYDILPLDDTEPWYTEEAQKKWEDSVINDLWKSFEEKIGYPNVNEMHDFAESLLDGMPTEGIKDTLDDYWHEEYAFSESFQKYVQEWLETIDTSVATVKKSSLVKNTADFFINFNYTDTLERVYCINNVLHIHGSVSACGIDPPIMGHGNKYLIDLYRRKAAEAQQEFIEWEESICNAIADYCEKLYKDTEKIIKANDQYFSDLYDVDQVICLGLSFGDVDIPYLTRIMHEIKSTTKWIIYYYDSTAYERLKSVFGILGISRTFETYFLPSESFWDKSST